MYVWYGVATYYYKGVVEATGGDLKMEIEEILNKEELEKIKKIGEIAVELKISMYENQKLNSEAQKILMGLVDEDADELIRDIINDKFVEYIDKKVREGKGEQ